MSMQKLLLAIAGATVLTASAHATTFGLAGSVGKAPTFSITSNGVTETYSSPAGNLFEVQNTTGLLSFSPALIDNNFFGSDNLTITFSVPQVGQIAIPFAIIDAFGTPGSDTLSVATNTGLSLTFGTTLSNLPLAEPEGTVSFVATSGVTSLTLSSPIAFAVGATSVPEPVSLSLLGVGLFGLAASFRRAR